MKDLKEIKHLEKVFGQTQDDVVTLEEAYKAGGVSQQNSRIKKMWILGKLKVFSKYDLAVPLNVVDRLPGKIKLTEKGKIALKRLPGDIGAIFSEKHVDQPTHDNIHEANTETADEVKEIVAILTQLKSANPGKKVLYKLPDKTISVE